MTALERHLHERTLELAAIAIDFELTSAESTELESQMAVCPECRRAAAAMRADAGAMRAALTLLPSRRVDDAVYAAIAGRQARPQRPWLLAAAALLLLALLGVMAVGAYLLTSPEILPATVVPTPTAPVAVVGPTSVPTASPDPAPSLVVPASTLRWELVGAIAGGTIKGLIGFDDGYVAFGNDLSQFGGPLAWFSTDGRSWEAIELSESVLNCPTWGPEGDENVPDADVGGGATNGREVVLVGEEQLRDGQACSDPGLSYRALAWATSDGRTWRRSDAFGISTRVEDVWAVPGGWLTMSDRGGLWQSVDGAAWHEIGSTHSGEHGLAQAAGPDGTLLVSESVLSTTGGDERVVLTVSADGQTWDEIPMPDGCEPGAGHILPPLLGGRGSWVVVPAGAATTCVSSDLERWESGSLQAPPDFAIHELVDTRYGILASGSVDCAGCPVRALKYLSNDGIAWTSLQEAGPEMQIADGPAGVIGLGGGESETSVWQLVATPTPTSIEPDVVLRVEIRPDVSVGRMPAMTVYRDGSVLRRDDTGGRVTRLNAIGLERLLAEARNSGLVEVSGRLASDPTYQGGTTTYTIDLRRGSDVVRRETTDAVAPASRVEAERLIALVEHLADLESWLPAGDWDVAASAAAPYVAANYLLKVTTYKGDADPRPIKDRAEIAWPLPGTLEGFGTPAEGQPLGPGTASRCGPLTIAEADAVQRALAGVPFIQTGDRTQAELRWADVGHLTVRLIPLLPEDPLDCGLDLSWP